MSRAFRLLTLLVLAGLSACAANETVTGLAPAVAPSAAAPGETRVIDPNAFAVTFSAPYTGTAPSLYIRITEITGGGKVSFSLTLPSGEQLWLERAAVGSEWPLTDTERLRLSEVDPPSGTAYFVIAR
ncbi:MAG: hypothetical protein AB1810_04845 [Pseudomonadota bacterium]